MKACIEEVQFTRRINDTALKPTGLSLALCAASQLLGRIAQWHTRRTVARKAKQELHALPNEILKDIGLNRGEIGNLAEALASRAQPCR
jgi:uncharacterized protein YjiS (DUF1127 family)